ncbi:MAG: SRPBCC family protein [Actinomycetota bacterium]
MRVQQEIGFAAPCEIVWEILLDWEAQARWMRDADRVEVLSPMRRGVGTTIAVRTRVLGVPLFTERLEVTVWEPPNCLVMAHRSILRGSGTWQLMPAGDGCRFRWTEDVALPVPVLGEIALRTYRPFLRWLMGGALGDLRSHIERERHVDRDVPRVSRPDERSL